MILIPGGNGYIGGAMVAELIRAGLTPVILDNLTTSTSEQMERLLKIFTSDINTKGIQPRIYKGDLGDSSILDKIFSENEIDAVMHFAASACVGESVENPEKYYQNNLLQSISLLSAMKKAGVKNFIFSSTCAVYGIPEKDSISETHGFKPMNPYGRTKRAMEWMLEDYCRAYGMRAVCFRYFNACGAISDGTWGEDHDPETHLIPNVLKAIASGTEVSVFGDDYETEDGTCVRDYVHICDLAVAHLKGLDWLKQKPEGSIDFFNLGTEKGLSVKEIISLCEQVTGKKANIKVTKRREGDPPKLVADSRKVREVLGWAPTYSPERIIETAWSWHQVGIKRIVKGPL